MGLKKLPPGGWARIRSGWKTGLAFGIGTAACIVTGLAFTGVVSVALLVLAVVVSTLVSLVASYLRGRNELLPHRFVDEIGNEPTFRAKFCTTNALREACDLTQNSYGHEYVSHHIAEKWRIRNPRGFVQILNPENQLCAAFGVLALRESFMDQFIAGRVSDRQLLGDDVCTWPESKKSSRLYISGIVVRQPLTYAGAKRARVMLWAMLEYLRFLYRLKVVRQLYAIAVTKESHRLMRTLGFVVEVPAERRTDHCDLYRLDLTKDTWNALLHRIGDLSPMCEVDFTYRSKPRQRKSLASGPSAASVTTEAAKTLPTTILFVVGDRVGSTHSQIQAQNEFEAIKDAMDGCKHKEEFRLALPIHGATRKRLVAAYRAQPDILHFAGHGDDRQLSLVLDQGLVASQTSITPEQLTEILNCFHPRVRLCVLNACASADVAKYLVDHHVVDWAIGWSGRVTDATAITFSGTLYRCLGDGLLLPESHILASQSCEPGASPRIYNDVSVNPEQYTFTKSTDR